MFRTMDVEYSIFLPPDKDASIIAHNLRDMLDDILSELCTVTDYNELDICYELLEEVRNMIYVRRNNR